MTKLGAFLHWVIGATSNYGVTNYVVLSFVSPKVANIEKGPLWSLEPSMLSDWEYAKSHWSIRTRNPK